MRSVGLFLIVCCAVPVALADGPSRPWIVPGLELSEPQVRTKPGFCKVTAKVKDKATKIKWKVRAQFEDSDVEFEWEPRDEGKAVQFTIPDSRGVVEVTAVAVIDGEPTDFAETTVTVEYKPRQTKAVKPKEEDKDRPQVLPKEAEPKDGKSGEKAKYVYYVHEKGEPDPDAKALMNGQGLTNKLRAAGVQVVKLEVGTAAYQQSNVDRYVKDAGGAPCVLFVNAKLFIYKKGLKLTAETKADDIVKGAGG
jgi:hypothetical protein